MKGSHKEEKIRREAQKKVETHDEGHFDESLFFAGLHKMSHPCGPCPDLTRIMDGNERWSSGPWKAVLESNAHADAREEMYAGMDMDNTHHHLVEAIFNYAMHTVASPSFKLAKGELTQSGGNQALVHSFSQFDTVPNTEEELIKLILGEAERHQERFRERCRGSSSESPKHQVIPKPTPPYIGELAHHSTRLSRPVTLMPRPILCGGNLPPNDHNPDALHREGIDGTQLLPYMDV